MDQFVSWYFSIYLKLLNVSRCTLHIYFKNYEHYTYFLFAFTRKILIRSYRYFFFYKNYQSHADTIIVYILSFFSSIACESFVQMSGSINHLRHERKNIETHETYSVCIALFLHIKFFFFLYYSIFLYVNIKTYFLWVFSLFIQLSILF